MKDGVSVRIDYSYDDSFFNWVTQFGMQCAAKSDIAAFGTFYFIGNCVGSLTMPSLSDKLGRKPLLIFQTIV